MSDSSKPRTHLNVQREHRTLADRQDGRASTLQKELQQRKPFPSQHAEAFLSLVRTADQMQHELRLRLKPYGITETQYNSLRILRGAGKQGLTCAEVGARLVSQAPDITRLMERLERLGLVRRERGVKDRRMVLTKITGAGLQRLKELDPAVTNTVNALLAHLSKDELESMIYLLERVRWNMNISGQAHDPRPTVPAVRLQPCIKNESGSD